MGLILFGKVSKVHGLSGEVRIIPFSRQLDNINSIQRIFITKTPDSKPIEFLITNKRVHKNTAVLKLKGLDSLEEAQAIVGSEVHVDTSDLRNLDEDEYYWFELIGLEVYSNKGEFIGSVKSLIDRSLQSLLVIQNDGKEYLIPLTEPIIEKIDIEKSKIIINPIEGLLE